MILNINTCIIIIIKCLDLPLSYTSVKMRRIGVKNQFIDVCSLVDNTSERWTKWKKIENKHVKQFKI